MAKQILQPPEIQYAATPSFSGLTPEEQAELDQLEIEFAQPEGLTLDEEIELQQLEAEFAPKSKEPEIAAGLVGKLGQGATFGLADELQAGLFAAPRALGNLIAGKEDASIGSAYNQLLDEQRANLAAAQEQYPITSTVAELAGGLGTLGGIGAGTKLGRAVYSAGAKGLAPAAVTTLGKAANVASKMGIGAGTGAATVGAYGFGSGEGGLDERLNEAESSAILGASVGAGIPLATTGLGAVGLALTPKIDEGIREVGKLAQKYNIPLSLDQLTSSKVTKDIQKVSQAVPFSGQANFRDKQLTAWNKAVTKSFGTESERITPEIIDKAFTRLGNQFSALGKGKTIESGDLVNNINKNITQDAGYTGISKDAVEGFESYLRDRLLPNIQSGNIKGETLNGIRAEVNALARKSTNFDAKTLYRDLENEIIDTLLPSKAGKKAFQGVKNQYKNLLAVEPLVAKEVGGNISPTLLSNRVAKIYKREFSRGKAGELGDLARIGKQLLPELGGSDTAQKLGYATAVITGGVNPASIPTIAAGVGLNRVMQATVNRNQKLIGKLLAGDKAAQKELIKLKPSEINAVKKAVKAVRSEPTINLKNTKK